MASTRGEDKVRNRVEEKVPPVDAAHDIESSDSDLNSCEEDETTDITTDRKHEFEGFRKPLESDRKESYESSTRSDLYEDPIEKEVRAHRSVSTVNPRSYPSHLAPHHAVGRISEGTEHSHSNSSLNEESVRAFVASTSRRGSSQSNFSYDGNRLSFDVSYYKAPDTPSPFMSADEQDHIELMHGIFPVIKYREKALIPHTRLLTLDGSNTHLVWWNPSMNKLSNFLRKKTLDISLIREIRLGQNTKNFMRFPFEGVEGQSISLLYEQEVGQWGYLRSLDLIFETEEHFDIWKEGLCLLVNDAVRHRDYYASFDPTLRWLKRYWISMSKDKEGNSGHREVSKFAKRLGKHFKTMELKKLYTKAINSQPQRGTPITMWGMQMKSSAINWDGFKHFFQLLNPREDILAVFQAAYEFPLYWYDCARISKISS